MIHGDIQPLVHGVTARCTIIPGIAPGTVGDTVPMTVGVITEIVITAHTTTINLF
jgi:hypothetical protein